MLVRGKTSIYFAIKFSLRKISYVVYVQASRARAILTGKSCTVGMRNAILRNHFNRTYATTYIVVNMFVFCNCWLVIFCLIAHLLLISH